MKRTNSREGVKVCCRLIQRQQLALPPFCHTHYSAEHLSCVVKLLVKVGWRNQRIRREEKKKTENVEETPQKPEQEPERPSGYHIGKSHPEVARTLHASSTTTIASSEGLRLVSWKKRGIDSCRKNTNHLVIKVRDVNRGRFFGYSSAHQVASINDELSPARNNVHNVKKEHHQRAAWIRGSKRCLLHAGGSDHAAEMHQIEIIAATQRLPRQAESSIRKSLQSSLCVVGWRVRRVNQCLPGCLQVMAADRHIESCGR